MLSCIHFLLLRSVVFKRTAVYACEDFNLGNRNRAGSAGCPLHVHRRNRQASGKLEPIENSCDRDQYFFGGVHPSATARAFSTDERARESIIAAAKERIAQHLEKGHSFRRARSCPLAWCNWRWGTAFAGESRAGQLAIA
jgi:hypothetical protein